MSKRERLQFFFTWLFLGLVPLFLRPLWEPDEARYSEIPREMLALGDWLTPRLNHVLYFEKPPLQYWLSAVSMKLFGVNAIAPRLPLALATFITMGAAFLLARRLGARRPIWAAFMAASTILGFVSAQILTLDALFSAFLVASFVLAVEAVAARYHGRSSLGWTLAAFLSVALALLTKGLAAPVLLGGIILASLPFAWSDAKLRRIVVGTLFNPFGWLVFLAVSTPWFWLVEKANPGHAQFFFIHEHFARFTSNVHARQGAKNPVADKLYFVGVLLVGLLPWLSTTVVGLKRGGAFVLRRKGPQAEGAALHRWIVAVTLLAFVVPLLFFSLSGSKLTQYILPVLVPLLALACALEREGEEPAALRRHGFELLFLGVAFAFLAPFLLKTPTGLPWILATGGSFLLLGFWALRPTGLTAERWMAGITVALLLFSLAAKATVEKDKSTAPLIAKAPANAQWISAGYYFQNLPYRTGQRVIIVGGTGELEFGKKALAPAEQAYWFREELHDLLSVAQSLRTQDPSRPVWALIDVDAWSKLAPQERGVWEVVDRSRAALLVRLR
ncbi:MAG: glycosyltransferase family 39 protein [Holophaga sp.]|nr:glycosyltransferase family 39 protein [Holophaga sp.]